MWTTCREGKATKIYKEKNQGRTSFNTREQKVTSSRTLQIEQRPLNLDESRGWMKKLFLEAGYGIPLFCWQCGIEKGGGKSNEDTINRFSGCPCADSPRNDIKSTPLSHEIYSEKSPSQHPRCYEMKQ